MTFKRKKRSLRKLPFSISSSRRLFVAAITRTSTVTGELLPTASNLCSSKTRSTFACAPALMSETSSRNSVAPSANSNFPFFAAVAPVNAPFTCPNNSDSISSWGMAAEFTSTKGAPARRDCACSARATNSLPVPDSPEIKTRPSVGATTSICLRSARMATDSPTMTYSCFSSAASSSLTRSSCLWRKAFRTVKTVFSIDRGFSMKTNAPSLVARTAVSMLPCPEILTTAASQFESRICRKVSRPSIPGNQTSSKTQPYTRRAIAFKHSSPLATAWAAKPSSRNTALSVSRMPRSSSTIRMESDILENYLPLPLGEGWGEDLSNCLAYAPHLRPFSQWEKGEKLTTKSRQLNHEPRSAWAVSFRVNASRRSGDYSFDDSETEARASYLRRNGSQKLMVTEGRLANDLV